MPHGNTFYEIALILGLAAVLGAAGGKLRQPLIVMFLAAGVLAGPAGLGIIHSHENIELLAHIGIALLLFIVGLKLDLNLIRTTGPVALATGAGQMALTSVAGFGLARALGLETVPALYVAIAVTFSSTIIIVKLLSDKKEIDSLHGRIAVGFLIVQDIGAILVLIGLTTLGRGVGGGEGGVAEASVARTVALIALKGTGLLAGVGLLMRYVLPDLTARLARSQEMLALAAIAWAVALGAASEWLGFSKEVGAFLAGVSLASTDFRDSIGARLAGLRDFLLLFFFIELGSRLDWSAVGSQVGPAVLLALFVLVSKPLILLVIMGAMGYRRRTGFMTGLAVAQISEFSLIITALGRSIGHITPETAGLITLIGVITIFFSSYMILYSGPLYARFAGPLKIFERRDPHRESSIGSAGDTEGTDVVLVGLGNYGSGLLEYLTGRGKRVTGVDFDPDALARWRNLGLPVVHGDPSDPEVLEHMILLRPAWIASTVRSRELNLAMLRQLRLAGFEGKTALTATTQEEADAYEAAGAHVVFRPFRDAAEQAADSLTHAMDILPENVDWPIAFSEIRLQTGSAFAGDAVRDIPLRSAMGVSLLAVSRAGRVHYDPGPDFKIFPGDRLVIMGHPDEIREAELLLNRLEEHVGAENPDRFVLDEIDVGPDSPWRDRSLADLKFRQEYGATVAGIRRGEEQITRPAPSERLLAGDALIVVGSAEAVGKLKIGAKS